MNQKLQKMPHILLRLEGAAVFIAVLILYAQNSFSWWQFALLLLAPDISMIGYLRDTAVGSLSYNVIHSYVLPLALGLFGLLANSGLALQLALIWLAHIGLDRLVGYGFKYPNDFKATHFDRI